MSEVNNLPALTFADSVPSPSFLFYLKRRRPTNHSALQSFPIRIYDNLGNRPLFSNSERLLVKIMASEKNVMNKSQIINNNNQMVSNLLLMKPL